MYLTILGNNGPFPSPNGACSGYFLESDSGETKILMDLGPGSLSRLLEIARMEELAGVVVSHMHFDPVSYTHLDWRWQRRGRPPTAPSPPPPAPEQAAARTK